MGGGVRCCWREGILADPKLCGGKYRLDKRRRHNARLGTQGTRLTSTLLPTAWTAVVRADRHWSNQQMEEEYYTGTSKKIIKQVRDETLKTLLDGFLSEELFLIFTTKILWDFEWKCPKVNHSSIKLPPLIIALFQPTILNKIKIHLFEQRYTALYYKIEYLV